MNTTNLVMIKCLVFKKDDNNNNIVTFRFFIMDNPDNNHNAQHSNRNDVTYHFRTFNKRNQNQPLQGQQQPANFENFYRDFF